VLQVTTWSSGVSSVVVLSSLGFKMEWFSNSVSSDSVTCWLTSASCSAPQISRSCSAARAPP
jgi:hypothetical protein